jgi:hypothetical protein
MDTLVDIFSGDAFSVRTLTDAINLVPIQYGRVNQLGLFQEKGVATTLVEIEFNNNVLNLIQSSARGTAAPKNKTGKRTAKPLSIPRIALDDFILPQDIQNVRQFGSMSLQTPSTVINDRLVSLARKHDITNEHLKCSALAGIILDADGSTLLNLFTEFNVSEVTVDFALDDTDTDVLEKCLEVTGNIEDQLAGDVMSGVHALWAPDAFADFIGHDSVKAAYANYMNMVNTTAGYAAATANPLRDDVRKGFYFGGIVHEEYRGKATDAAGNVRKFIADGTARFFPMGTSDTFRHYNAPADWMETVNTIGAPRYAKVLPDLGGRHVEILTQSNPLPLCVKPKLLVKGTA